MKIVCEIILKCIVCEMNCEIKYNCECMQSHNRDEFMAVESEARMAMFTSAVQEADAFHYNPGPPLAPRYHTAVFFEGFQWGP